jgi:hypothetical protein
MSQPIPVQDILLAKFTYGGYQDVKAIRETIPVNYLQFFDEGYNW